MLFSIYCWTALLSAVQCEDSCSIVVTITVKSTQGCSKLCVQSCVGNKRAADKVTVVIMIIIIIIIIVFA